MSAANRARFAEETEQIAKVTIKLAGEGVGGVEIAAKLGHSLSALRSRMRRSGHLDEARVFERAIAETRLGTCAKCGATVAHHQTRCHPCAMADRASKRTNMERILDRVKVTDSGCWEWQGAKSDRGYGWIKIFNPRRDILVHRLAWMEANGRAIPDGLHVLHSCDNPPCVNPAHLSVGTHADNMLDRHVRGRHANARKTHCPQGHPYDEANTIRSEKGYRTCRSCRTSAKRPKRASRK